MLKKQILFSGLLLAGAVCTSAQKPNLENSPVVANQVETQEYSKVMETSKTDKNMETSMTKNMEEKTHSQKDDHDPSMLSFTMNLPYTAMQRLGTNDFFSGLSDMFSFGMSDTIPSMKKNGEENSSKDFFDEETSPMAASIVQYYFGDDEKEGNGFSIFDLMFPSANQNLDLEEKKIDSDKNGKKTSSSMREKTMMDETTSGTIEKKEKESSSLDDDSSSALDKVTDILWAMFDIDFTSFLPTGMMDFLDLIAEEGEGLTPPTVTTSIEKDACILRVEHPKLSDKSTSLEIGVEDDELLIQYTKIFENDEKDAHSEHDEDENNLYDKKQLFQYFKDGSSAVLEDVYEKKNEADKMMQDKDHSMVQHNEKKMEYPMMMESKTYETPAIMEEPKKYESVMKEETTMLETPQKKMNKRAKPFEHHQNETSPKKSVSSSPLMNEMKMDDEKTKPTNKVNPNMAKRTERQQKRQNHQNANKRNSNTNKSNLSSEIHPMTSSVNDASRRLQDEKMDAKQTDKNGENMEMMTSNEKRDQNITENLGKLIDELNSLSVSSSPNTLFDQDEKTMMVNMDQFIQNYNENQDDMNSMPSIFNDHDLFTASAEVVTVTRIPVDARCDNDSDDIKATMADENTLVVKFPLKKMTIEEEKEIAMKQPESGKKVRNPKREEKAMPSRNTSNSATKNPKNKMMGDKKESTTEKSYPMEKNMKEEKMENSNITDDASEQNYSSSLMKDMKQKKNERRTQKRHLRKSNKPTTSVLSQKMEMDHKVPLVSALEF